MYNIEDDDEMFLIKQALSSLTSVQRKIYLTYLESGTYTATAKEFGVSVPTIRTYINNINDIIKEYVFNHS